MSIGLRNSTIETFRKRYHGNNQLRLYQLVNEGQNLNLLRILERGFFIGKNTDTSVGAMPFLLTIDSQYTPGLKETEIMKGWGVDLINPDTDSYRRYRFDSNDTPQNDESRFIIGMHAAFNDNKTVL